MEYFPVKSAVFQPTCKGRVSKNAVFGLNFLPGFWTWQILWIVPILTGFGPHPRGPKSGQGQLADLDALVLNPDERRESFTHILTLLWNVLMGLRYHVSQW